MPDKLHSLSSIDSEDDEEMKEHTDHTTSSASTHAVLISLSTDVFVPLCKVECISCVLPQTMEEHLQLFACEGLRTLVITKREVSSAESSHWLRRFVDASNSVGNREDNLAAVAADIEHDLLPLGISAIEDKLQEGVPETISALKQAGCKVWMLTGDKEETAVNIGRSCSLISEKMSLVFLNAPDREGFVQQLVKARAELRSRKLWSPGTMNDQLGVVIQGHSLAHVLSPFDRSSSHNKSWIRNLLGMVVLSCAFHVRSGDCCCGCCFCCGVAESEGAGSKVQPVDQTTYDREALENSLLELIQQCQAVIACRVSPLQVRD